MCQCGCGDLIPHEVLMIDDNRFMVFEKYPGCEYCGTEIGVSIHFFDKKGYEEWLDHITPTKVKFDEYGGSIRQYLIFDVQMHLAPSAEQVKKDWGYSVEDYDTLGEYLNVQGLRLVQGAMKEATKFENSKK